MARTKIAIHVVNLDARKKALKKWAVSSEDKKELLRFLEDLELGKVNKGRKISQRRQLKYLDLLKISLRFFKKPCSKLTLKDVETFEKALSSDRLQSAKLEPFAPSTKADIRRALKVYLKWKLGDTDRFRELTEWFDCRVPIKTPEYLSEEEVELLFKACKSNEERFFVAVLFDSGARAEEFHNIRCEDIKFPEEGENFVKLTIKTEYSKTTGRCISLYWKHCLDAVRDFLEDRRKQGIRSGDPVFAGKYDNARRWLTRLGKKILGKPVHYHLFRHSSATYYASRLNRQQICYRYGWKFSSDMPDVYISRSGMQNAELDEKFKATEIEEVKKQNEQLQLEVAKMSEEIGQRSNPEISRDQILSVIAQDKEGLGKIARAMARLGLVKKAN